MYKAAYQKVPEDALLLRVMALCSLSHLVPLREKTRREAVNWLDRAQALDPKGKTFQKAQDCFFKWAVVRHGENPLVWLQLALIEYCIYHNYREALRMFKRAIAIDPNCKIVVVVRSLDSIYLNI